MKILYISSEYPPETGNGGIGTYTRYAAEAMAVRGHTVGVIAQINNDAPPRTVRNGVTIFRVPPSRYPLPNGRWFFPLRFYCYHFIPHLLIRLSWIWAVKEAVKKVLDETFVPDIIESPECGAEGYGLSNSVNSRLIVRLHTPWKMVSQFDSLREPVLDRILLNRIEKNLAQKAAAVSSPSHALADILKKKWSLPQVKVFPNPIASHEFPQSHGSGLIYTGRIERRKGIHVLIEAYSRLPHTQTTPRLTLVGRPFGTSPNGEPYGDHISKMIENLDLKDRITWVLGAAPLRVVDYLLQASIAIIPSLWENFPYSCLESMACGLAVVASRCGGIPEMVTHGDTGFLVSPNDPDELTQLLEKLIGNPSLVSSVGKSARKKTHEIFGFEAVSSSMETFYREIK